MLLSGLGVLHEGWLRSRGRNRKEELKSRQFRGMIGLKRTQGKAEKEIKKRGTKGRWPTDPVQQKNCEPLRARLGYRRGTGSPFSSWQTGEPRRGIFGLGREDVETHILVEYVAIEVGGREMRTKRSRLEGEGQGSMFKADDGDQRLGRSWLATPVACPKVPSFTHFGDFRRRVKGSSTIETYKACIMATATERCASPCTGASRGAEIVG